MATEQRERVECRLADSLESESREPGRAPGQVYSEVPVDILAGWAKAARALVSEVTDLRARLEQVTGERDRLREMAAPWACVVRCFDCQVPLRIGDHFLGQDPDEENYQCTTLVCQDCGPQYAVADAAQEEETGC